MEAATGSSLFVGLHIQSVCWAPQQTASPFRGVGFVTLKLKEVRFVMSPAMDHSIRRAMVPHSRAAQGLEISECILASPSLVYLQCFHFHR